MRFKTNDSFLEMIIKGKPFSWIQHAEAGHSGEKNAYMLLPAGDVDGSAIKNECCGQYTIYINILWELAVQD